MIKNTGSAMHLKMASWRLGYLAPEGKRYILNMNNKNNIINLSKQLKNIGPKLAEKLVEVGIETPEQLREIGAKQAFKKMYAHGDAYGDYNAAYLYALEGAIRGCDWLDIPNELKEEFKTYAQDLQFNKKNST